MNKLEEVLLKMVLAAEQLTLDAEKMRDPGDPMFHQVTYQFGFAEGLRAALTLARSRARRQENA